MMNNKALRLYRRILRIAREWKGGPVEQHYIRTEARSQFEQYRNVRDASEVQDLIKKGHDRVDIAVHYEIPYPRLHYADPHTTMADQVYNRLSSRDKTGHSVARKHGRMKWFK